MNLHTILRYSCFQSIQHCLFFFLFLFISNTIQWKTQFNLNKVCFFHPCKIFFVQQTVGHIVYLLKKTSKNHWHCKNRQRFEGRIGYQILIFRHYHIPPWYPIHLPSQIPIYQSLISHIIHHKYENFYPPSIDLKFKIGGFFLRSKKYLRNFEKTPPKNALPFQTSEGVNSEPRKRKPFTCTLKTEYTGH